jgi:hypothetical protein
MTNEPRPYQWDFSGHCAPRENWKCGSPWQTFSLGIFQWVPKASGEGLKRGKVVRRVSGKRSDPKPVYDAARAICDELNGKGGAE